MEWDKTETKAKDTWAVGVFRKQECYKQDRCKYCRTSLPTRKGGKLLTEDRDKHWRIKGYCSEWCWEIDNPQKIKNNTKKCILCGDITLPHTRINKDNGHIISTGMYPKYCENCTPPKGRPRKQRDLHYKP